MVQKSALFFAGIDDIDKRVLEAHGFKKGVFPLRYLGLPLMSRKLKLKEFAPLFDALEKRFGSWQLKNISYAGRLQLLRSVILSLVNFWGAAFCLPKGCIKRIEQLCQRFLWSGKSDARCSHKVSWETVCTPKEEGGLGLRNFSLWNKTLLLKLAWRLMMAKDSLWVTWMKDKYLKGDWLWSVSVKDSQSWVWKAILSLRPLIKTFLRSKIGNGKDTSFWFDSWASRQSFFDICGEQGFARLGIQKLASVEDAERAGIWDRMHADRTFRDSNLSLIQSLIVSQKRPSESEEEDRWFWSRDPEVMRLFSSRYTWNELHIEGIKSRWAKLVWFKGALPKHSFIFWLTFLNRLPTFDRLHSWGCVQSPVCPRCSGAVETIEHLFIRCEAGETVWRKVTKRLEGHAFLINDWESLVSWLLIPSLTISKTLKRVAVQATIYQLWRSRNLIVYENQTIPQETVFKQIDRDVRDLLLARRRRPSYAKLLQEWFKWE